MKRLKSTTIALLLGASLFVSCDKDDPVIPNEEEVITTLIYTLTPAEGGAPIELKFQDLDLDGPNDPIITDGVLAGNTTYIGVLEVLNELESPSEDITVEVLGEDEDHQFFFQSTVPGLTVSYSDQDENGNPVGINTNLVTTSLGTGTITVVLRHEPNKSAVDVVNGDITNAGGETDVEATLNINVQ